ncbi:MAG: hypothetical protein AB7P40_09590 [Chloroflexota bacterium]
MHTRFRDDASLPMYDGSPSLVECPRCRERAELVFQISPDNPSSRSYTAPPRVVCSRCSYAEVRNPGQPVTRDEAREPLTGLPLWLQTPCAGHVLWAWNSWHLDFLERYVSAGLRERTPNINVSLASRLPAWIKSAKNRDDVLKGIRRLRHRLGQSNGAS